MTTLSLLLAVALWHALDALRDWWRARRFRDIETLPLAIAPSEEPHEPDTIELLAREELKMIRKLMQGDAP